jgi:aldose 1-epimerase
VTSSSVSLSFYDPEGVMGFPGSVTSQVKYSLLPGGVWDIAISAQASARTPILLSSHVYWNLDGYSVKNSSVKDWYLNLPYATKVVETDTILIPTGGWKDTAGTAYDFTKARTIGERWNETLGYPGIGGYGYDTCWINEDGADPNAVKVCLIETLE